MLLYLLLAGVILVAVLAPVFISRRRAKKQANPVPQHPRVLRDPSTVRPDVYIDGQQIPDRRSEPRHSPGSPGLRQEPIMDDRGAVAFVPPPAPDPSPAKASPDDASSPEELGIDLTPQAPPTIESLPPERERQP